MIELIRNLKESTCHVIFTIFIVIGVLIMLLIPGKYNKKQNIIKEEYVEDVPSSDTVIYKLWRINTHIETNSKLNGDGYVSGFIGIEGRVKIRGESTTENIVSFYQIEENFVMYRKEYKALDVAFKITNDIEPTVMYITHYDIQPNTRSIIICCSEEDFPKYININSL